MSEPKKKLKKRKPLAKKTNEDGIGKDLTGPRGGLPPKLFGRVGTVGIRKTTVDGINVICWDATDDCDPYNCLIAGRCEYAHIGRRVHEQNKYVRKKAEEEKREVELFELEEIPCCQMEKEYLYQSYKMALNAFAGDLTQEIVTKIGFHLIPLYLHLIQIKMALKGNPERIYFLDNGTMKVNPLYKEHREILAKIEGTWKMLDLDISKLPPESEEEEKEKEVSFLDVGKNETLQETKRKMEVNANKIRKKRLEKDVSEGELKYAQFK